MSLKCISVVCIIVMLSYTKCSPIEYETGLTMITREDWGARPPTATSQLETPVPFVVIHHSSVPGACFSREECSAAMRSMQYTHQVYNQWADIGYNFAVGSDGLVYEGRGWENVGAHAVGVNARSIGIVLIGHWVSELPPRAQLDTAQQLIWEGIRKGYISPYYSLVGHRLVGTTECPGDALYAEIEHWSHYTNSVEL